MVPGRCSVESVDPETADRNAILACRGISKKALARKQCPISVLITAPESADFLNLEFRAKGYVTRQHCCRKQTALLQVDIIETAAEKGRYPKNPYLHVGHRKIDFG